MKWLVWLLLLMNAVLFGYFHLTGQHVADSSSPAQRDFAAERLRVLTAQEVARLPLKEAAEPTVASAASVSSALCYEWGSFAAADAAAAQAALSRLGLKAEARQQAAQDAVRYWVFIPPRQSLEEAQAKVSELRALGVQESFIVQEAKWRNAISLGVFRDEALADKFLADLKSRGVRSAIKSQRNHEGGQTSYILRNVQPAQAAEIARLRPEFPGGELKQIDCQ